MNLIGVDERTCGDVSDFAKYLLHPANRQSVAFGLHESGYPRSLPESGWGYRRQRALVEKALQKQQQAAQVTDTDESQEPADPYPA